MNKLALINPEFLKFPEDIQQRIYERIKKGDRYFFLMRKEEIEKELEEEERLERKQQEEGHKRARLENMIPKQIEAAIEKLGRDNVFGPQEVEKTFGVHLREVPEIPFSVAELECAEKMGQMLVLRIDKTEKGKPMSMEAMNTIIVKRWEKDGRGSLLNTVDGWRGNVTGEEDFKKVTPRSGWALVSKNLLPDSTSKNYIEQTEIIIKTLQEKAFKDMELPEEYVEAIAEFESQKERLTKLMSENWLEAAKQLSELKINQLTRSSIQETIYDLAMYYDTHGKRLLPDRYTLSNSCSWRDHLMSLGRFDAWGVHGISGKPDNRDGHTGVSLSRRR